MTTSDPAEHEGNGDSLAAANRDQAAGRRDHDAAKRDAVADLRDEVASRRDLEADQRDSDAQTRDGLAEQRDAVAEARDEVSERMEARSTDPLIGKALRRAEGVRKEAAADRTRASLDRGAGADERGIAQQDRDTALSDRGAGARERAHAEFDRLDADADRQAAETDRDSASLDGLTGAYLRANGVVELDRDIARARRNRQPLILAFLDVDGLKAINDVRGHAAGDRMLRAVADTCRAMLRAQDVIIRYGGDEFLCAMSGLTLSEATGRLQQVNSALVEADEPGSVTVGFAELEAADTGAELVARADAALYRERRRRAGI